MRLTDWLHAETATLPAVVSTPVQMRRKHLEDATHSLYAYWQASVDYPTTPWWALTDAQRARARGMVLSAMVGLDKALDMGRIFGEGR